MKKKKWGGQGRKFAGKWVEVEKDPIEWGNQIQKDKLHVLSYLWFLDPSL